MSVVGASYENPMKLEEQASAPLAGGIVNNGYQCGMLWGAALAAGAEVYRRFGSGPQAETTAIMVSKTLLQAFQTRTQNEINCTEIIEFNFQQMKGLTPFLKYLVKGGKIGPGACFRLAAGYAQDAFDTLDAALPQQPIDGPAHPVSCASELAKKMGASDKHALMAAGFAGGIALSGGGCGALGAAIWLTAMKPRRQGIPKIGYFENPDFEEVIERFLEASDFEFECSQIVGRKFESIDDHAAYIHDGGCLGIIEALSSPADNRPNENLAA